MASLLAVLWWAQQRKLPNPQRLAVVNIAIASSVPAEPQNLSTRRYWLCRISAEGFR